MILGIKKESLFNNILNKQQNAIVVLDLQLNIVYANQSYFKNTDLEDILKNSTNILHPYYYSLFEKYKQSNNIKSSNDVTPFIITTKNSTKIEIVSEPLYVKDTFNGLIVTFKFIDQNYTNNIETNYKHIIDKQQQILDMTFTSVFGGSWEFYINEGVIFWGSEIIKKYWDYKNVPDTIEKFVINHVHPEDLSLFLENFEPFNSMKTNEFECDIRIWAKEKKYQWVKLKGQVNIKSNQKQISLGVLINIDQTKQNELFLDSILQSAYFYIIVVNNDYDILYLNNSFQRFIFERTKKNIEIGQNLSNSLPFDTFCKFQHYIDKSFNTKQTTQQEIGFFDKWIMYKISPVLNDLNEVVRVNIIFMDFSEHKKEINSLKKEQEQLQDIIDIVTSNIKQTTIKYE